MEKILLNYKEYSISYPKYDYQKSDKSEKNGNIIYYKTKADALSLTFNQNLMKVDRTKRGLMIDCSRGKVYKIEVLKEFILKSVALGINYINLYLEDLIDLKMYKQYGYLRGKYTDDELKQLVDLAHELEIDIYPAIQTLGHLEHFLRWEQSENLKDTDKVLEVGNEEVYKFLEALISKCKQIFQNDTINIGMDEAFDLGMGKQFRKTAKIDQKELFLQHLNKVVSICHNNGYNNIKMWSDMLFSIYANASEDNLYSTNFNKEDVVKLSADIEIIYWNYWSCQTSEYKKSIKAHKLFTNKVSIALGIHMWAIPFYDYNQLEVTKAATKAIKEEKVGDILYTMWNDDGALCNLDSTYLGIYESMVNLLEFKSNKEDFLNITKLEYDIALKISKFNNYNINFFAVIWNDPITNIYLKTIKDDELENIIINLEKIVLFDNDKLICNIYNSYIECIKHEIKLYLNIKKKTLTNKKLIDDCILNYKELFRLLEQNFMTEAKLYGLEELQRRLVLKLYRFNFLEKYISLDEVDLIFNESLEDYNTDIKKLYNGIAFATSNRW